MSIHEIADEILAEMGGDPEIICQGDCPTFAMKLIDRVGRGQIVSNLSNDMQEEISGYDVIAPEVHIAKPSARNYYQTSHCWVKIDGRYYDAFDTYGVNDEAYLQFIEKNG